MTSDGDRLPFAEVVAASDGLSATRSRKQKAEIIGDLLDRSGRDGAVVVGLLVGEPRQGRIGVGYAGVFAVDVPPAEQGGLTVSDVDAAFDELAVTTGSGSRSRRQELLAGLFARATADEQDYLRRVLTGEVRHGALEGLVLDAVASSTGIDAELVRRAAMLRGNVAEITALAVSEGAGALQEVGLEVMRPVLPMLAKTAADVATALETAGRSVVDWKLDGARVQVHRRGEEVAVFTRNLNDVTARVPAVAAVVAALEVESVVLDGEALSITAGGLPARFQETMSRFGADNHTGDDPVVPFFFDILHLDGRDLIDESLETRLELLDGVVPEEHRIPRLVTAEVADADRFLADARSHSHEGVMVKALDSRYEAGRRGATWVKVKPVHTLDLVVLAAEWGHGRRTGKLSNLHLGARDPAGGFVMLGKTFKGLTDEMLAWQTERFLELETHRTGHVVHVRPEQVVEVAFDGLLPSPRYPGGLALRFARVRGYRPDKDASEADTIDTVRAIHEGRPLTQGEA